MTFLKDLLTNAAQVGPAVVRQPMGYAPTMNTPVQAPGNESTAFQDYLGSTRTPSPYPQQIGGGPLPYAGGGDSTGGQTPKGNGPEFYSPEEYQRLATEYPLTPDKVREMYRLLLQRDPSDQEIQGHLSNPGGQLGLLDTIQKSPEFASLDRGYQLQGGMTTPGAIPFAGSDAPRALPGVMQAIAPRIASGLSTILSRANGPGPFGINRALGAFFGAPATAPRMTGTVQPMAGAVGASAANPWATIASGLTNARTSVAPPSPQPQAASMYTKPRSSISLAEPPREIWPGESKR